MVIDDLKQSVSELSDEELMNLLIGVRASRRVNKKPVAEKKEKKTKTIDLNALVSGMNKSDMAALLAALEGEEE